MKRIDIMMHLTEPQPSYNRTLRTLCGKNSRHGDRGFARKSPIKIAASIRHAIRRDDGAVTAEELHCDTDPISARYIAFHPW